MAVAVARQVKLPPVPRAIASSRELRGKEGTTSEATIVQESAESMLEEALRRVKDKEPQVRVVALESLEHLASPGQKAAVEAVAEALQDRHHPARSTAIRVLRFLAGPLCREASVAEHAFEAAARLLEDPVPRWKREAAEILADLYVQGDERSLALVASRLESELASVRLAAQDALLRMARPTSNELLLQVVARHTSSQSSEAREAAAQVLVAAGGQSSPMIAEAVSRLLGSQDEMLRAFAVRFLSEMEPDAVVPVLLVLIRASASTARCGALRALRIAGRARADALTQVFQCLQDPDPHVRMTATPIPALIVDGCEELGALAIELSREILAESTAEVREVVMVALASVAKNVLEAANIPEFAAKRARRRESLYKQKARISADDFSEMDEDQRLRALMVISPQTLQLMGLEPPGSEGARARVAGAAEAAVTALPRFVRRATMRAQTSEQLQPELSRSFAGFNIEEGFPTPLSPQKALRAFGRQPTRLETATQDAFFTPEQSASFLLPQDDGTGSWLTGSEASSMSKSLNFDALDREGRKAALAMLAKSARHASRAEQRAALAVLKASLQDPLWEVRAAGLEAVASMDCAHSETLAAIVEASSDCAWQVRLAAIRALTSLVHTSVGQRVISGLLPALRDWKEEVALEAFKVLNLLPLHSLDDEDVPHNLINTLLASLQSPFPSVQMHALNALRKLARASKEIEALVVGNIAEQLNHEVETVRADAFNLLISMRPEAAYEAVLRQLSSAVLSGRKLALRIMAHFAEVLPAARVAVAAAIQDPHETIRLQALSFLRNLSLRAQKEIRPEVELALRSDSESVRCVAREALDFIEDTDFQQ